MATLGTGFVNILAWHKKSDTHPIFSAEYFRENLVSFAETIVMLAAYFVLGVLALHFAYILDLLEAETLLWLFVENGARFLYLGLPLFVFESPYWAIGFFLVTVVMIFVLHFAFDVLKAKLHPNFKKEFATFKILRKVTVRKSLKPVILKRLNQFRDFMTA